MTPNNALQLAGSKYESFPEWIGNVYKYATKNGKQADSIPNQT